jgi:hypothetical protein
LFFKESEMAAFDLFAMRIGKGEMDWAACSPPWKQSSLRCYHKDILRAIADAE